MTFNPTPRVPARTQHFGSVPLGSALLAALALNDPDAFSRAPARALRPTTPPREESSLFDVTCPCDPAG